MGSIRSKSETLHAVIDVSALELVMGRLVCRVDGCCYLKKFGEISERMKFAGKGANPGGISHSPATSFDSHFKIFGQKNRVSHIYFQN